MTEDVDRATRLYNCAAKATSEMNARLSTPEGIIEEHQRQRQVGLMDMRIFQREQHESGKTEQWRYVG